MSLNQNHLDCWGRLEHPYTHLPPVCGRAAFQTWAVNPEPRRTDDPRGDAT